MHHAHWQVGASCALWLLTFRIQGGGGNTCKACMPCQPQLLSGKGEELAGSGSGPGGTPEHRQHKAQQALLVPALRLPARY